MLELPLRTAEAVVAIMLVEEEETQPLLARSFMHTRSSFGNSSRLACTASEKTRRSAKKTRIVIREAISLRVKKKKGE